MAYYRLYFMVGGHISDVVDFVCDDDAAALGRAAVRRDGRAMELWELSRLVATWEAQADRETDPALSRLCGTAPAGRR